MNIASHKKTILIMIILLVVFFGYWFFFISGKEKDSDSILITTQSSNVTASYDKEFVTSLLNLNSVNLDTSVFEVPVYKALTYPEVPFIVDLSYETGRINPFLPIGYEAINPNQNVPIQQIIEKTESDNSSTTTSATSTPVKPKPVTF